MHGFAIHFQSLCQMIFLVCIVCKFILGIKDYQGKNWKDTHALPDTELCIVMLVDGMAFIQRNTLESTTFFALQKKYLNKLFEGLPAENCSLVKFVADQYDFGDGSLKSEERAKRSKGKKKPKEYQPADNVKVPEWKPFMEVAKNKSNLLEYLCASWELHFNDVLKGKRAFLVVSSVIQEELYIFPRME